MLSAKPVAHPCIVSGRRDKGVAHVAQLGTSQGRNSRERKEEMGSCGSKSAQFTPDPHTQGQGAEVLPLAKKLGLRPTDLDTLWQAFCTFDLDEGGNISIAEFIVMGQLEDSETIGKLLFRLWDADNSGTLDFTEFMLSLWTICSADHTNLILFCHSLFDFDNNESLDGEELAFIVNVIWNFRPSQSVSAAIAKLDVDKDGSVSRAEFLGRIRWSRSIMIPIYALYNFLRRFSLGTGAWERIEKYRTKHFGSQTAFEIVGLSLLETQWNKSGPMDLLLEMSLKPGGAETMRVPKAMETKFEAAHAMRLGNRKSKAKSRAKATLAEVQREALRVTNERPAQGKSRMANFRDAAAFRRRGGQRLPELTEKSIQTRIAVPKEREELPPLQQNLLNRSSATVAAWQVASGSTFAAAERDLMQAGRASGTAPGLGFDFNYVKPGHPRPSSRAESRRPSTGAAGGAENEPPAW